MKLELALHGGLWASGLLGSRLRVRFLAGGFCDIMSCHQAVSKDVLRMRHDTGSFQNSPYKILNDDFIIPHNPVIHVVWGIVKIMVLFLGPYNSTAPNI